MQTGKIALPAYLSTIRRWRGDELERDPLRDPSLCGCGRNQLSGSHALQHCPQYGEIRQETLGGSSPRGLRNILGSGVYARKAVEFMGKTGLLGRFRSLKDIPQVLQAC